MMCLIALTALTIGAYTWLKHLAENDKFFACYVPTNEVVAINRGGAFHRFLFDPTGGTHLNDPRSWQFDSLYRPWERLPNTWDWHKSSQHKVIYVDERNWFTRLTGIYFFLPLIESVDEYPFDWTTYVKTEIDATGKKKHFLKPHDKEEVRSIYAKVVQYYGQVMVLTQDGIDVLVDFTFDVDLTNPFVARFARGNFLGQVKSRLEAELRNYVGDQLFAQLFSETDTKKPETPGGAARAGGHGRFYENFVKKLNLHIENDPVIGDVGFEALYGVTVKAFHILDIQDPTGQSAKQVEARQSLEIARKALEISEVKAQEEHNRGKGEANRQREINTVEIARAKALMEIETATPWATKVAMAGKLFANAKVVSMGENGLKTLINPDNLSDPAPPQQPL